LKWNRYCKSALRRTGLVIEQSFLIRNANSEVQTLLHVNIVVVRKQRCPSRRIVDCRHDDDTARPLVDSSIIEALQTMDTVLNGNWVSVVLQALHFLCGVHGSRGQSTLNVWIQQLQRNRACMLQCQRSINVLEQHEIARIAVKIFF